MGKISSLKVRYPEADCDAVRSFSLTFSQGEAVVIFGPNGSGKTTGLKALAGIMPAQDLIADIGPEQCAYVHQDPFMFRRRVSANIAFGLKPLGTASFGALQRPADRRRIAYAVREVAERCAVDGILGRRATQLSGGQRQRVAVARALALDRPVLLLDEPTANLDAESRGIMATIVREEVRRGKTVVIASHDESFAYTVGDKFYFMRDGELAERRMNLICGSLGQVEDQLDTLVRPSGFRVFGGTLRNVQNDVPARGVFRPEDVVLSAARMSSSALNAFAVEVESLLPHPEGGVLVILRSTLDPDVSFASAVSERSVRELDVGPGRVLHAGVKASSVSIFPEPT
jgi:molybdate transport system permease protein